MRRLLILAAAICITVSASTGIARAEADYRRLPVKVYVDKMKGGAEAVEDGSGAALIVHTGAGSVRSPRKRTAASSAEELRKLVPQFIVRESASLTRTQARSLIGRAVAPVRFEMSPCDVHGGDHIPQGVQKTDRREGLDGQGCLHDLVRFLHVGERLI